MDNAWNIMELTNKPALMCLFKKVVGTSIHVFIPVQVPGVSKGKK